MSPGRFGGDALRRNGVKRGAQLERRQSEENKDLSRDINTTGSYPAESDSRLQRGCVYKIELPISQLAAHPVRVYSGYFETAREPRDFDDIVSNGHNQGEKPTKCTLFLERCTSVKTTTTRKVLKLGTAASSFQEPNGQTLFHHHIVIVHMHE